MLHDVLWGASPFLATDLTIFSPGSSDMAGDGLFIDRVMQRVYMAWGRNHAGTPDSGCLSNFSKETVSWVARVVANHRDKTFQSFYLILALLGQPWRL